MTLQEYLKNNPKKYIIFDLDRTLVWLDIDWGETDHFEKFFKLLFTSMEKIDKKAAFDFISSIKSSPYSEGWREKMNCFLKDHPQGQKIMVESNAVFELSHYHGHDRLNNEFVTFLKENYAKYIFYLYTSNSRKITEAILKKFELYKFFKKIITRDEVLLIKPNPEGFFLIYQKSADKKDYLMVGDGKADWGMAKNAGIDYLEVKM